MSALTILVPPISGAVIGYFTNWLAIKMLFRPHTQKHVFGVKIPFTPGLIPKERHALAKKIGDLMKNSVLTESVMRDYITSPDIRQKLETIVSDIVDDFFAKDEYMSMIPVDFWENMRNLSKEKFPDLVGFIKALPEKNPQIDITLKELISKIARENFGSFINIFFINSDKIYENIKKNVFEYLESTENQTLLADKLADGINNLLTSGFQNNVTDEWKVKIKEVITNAAAFSLDKMAGKIAAAFEFDKIVENKINDFSVAEAETLILSVVNRELNSITIIGGVLGFVIGWSSTLISLFT